MMKIPARYRTMRTTNWREDFRVSCANIMNDPIPRVNAYKFDYQTYRHSNKNHYNHETRHNLDLKKEGHRKTAIAQ